MEFKLEDGVIESRNNTVNFEALIEAEGKGFRVRVLRNNVEVYTAERLSSTFEKAQRRAGKAMADALYRESQAVRPARSGNE